MPNVAQRGGMSADAAGDWLGDTFSLVPSVARVAGAVIGKVKVGVGGDTLVAGERLIEEGLLRTPSSRKAITVLRAAAVLAIFLHANAASRS